MAEEKKTIPLGQLLLDKKLISEEQLSKALEEQKRTKDRLGHTLVKSGYVSSDDLIEVLEEQFGIPAVKINLKMLNSKVVKTIPENICRKYRLIPILLDENNYLTIAATNPYDISFKDEIKFITDYNIDFVLSPESSVLEAINHIFGKKDFNWAGRDDEIYESYIKSEISANKMFEMIMQKAIQLNCSEIQLEYFENNFTVVYTAKDKVVSSKSFPDFYYAPITLQIKNLAGLQSDKKSFQEGLLNIEINRKKYTLRALVFQNPRGENITLKLS